VDVVHARKAAVDGGDGGYGNGQNSVRQLNAKFGGGHANKSGIFSIKDGDITIRPERWSPHFWN
jgi:hypothetical protein